MFCLFRSSHIHPSLNIHAILLSLLGAISWLYFSFIEKSLVSKVFDGDALIIDLVFGLPLVLMLAVVVYATAYWSCKILIMLLLPKYVVARPDEVDQLYTALDDKAIKELEVSFCKDYWQKEEVEQSSAKIKKEPNHNFKA